MAAPPAAGRVRGPARRRPDRPPAQARAYSTARWSSSRPTTGSPSSPASSAARSSPTTVDQIAGVPLFVKAPGQRRGEVDDRPARTVDVLPTIAAMLGVELPSRWTARRSPGRRATRGAQVSVADRSGGEESLSLDDYLDRRAEVVAEKIALFGTGGWRDLYRFGPHSELIGQPAPSGSDAGVHARGRRPLRGRKAAAPWRFPLSFGARSGERSAPASRSPSRSTERSRRSAAPTRSRAAPTSASSFRRAPSAAGRTRSG